MRKQNNIGRPRTFDEQKALDAAMQVFWSHGYEATSLDDLLAAMNLSKSSFYQTFDSKHRLMERCITRYSQIIVDDMLYDLQSADSGIGFLRHILMRVAEGVNEPQGRRGCLMMNSAAEFGTNDIAFSRLIVEGTIQFKTVFLAAIKQAQQEEDIAQDKDAHVLAGYLVSCKSGLETMTKTGASAASLSDIVEVMLSALS